jgi:hypothetical protein
MGSVTPVSPPASSSLTERLSSARLAADADPVKSAPTLNAVPDQPLSSQVLGTLMNLSASPQGADATA